MPEIGIRDLEVGTMYVGVNVNKWDREFQIINLGKLNEIKRTGSSIILSTVYLIEYIFENGSYTMSSGYRDAGGDLNPDAKFFIYTNNDDYLIAMEQAERLRPSRILRPSTDYMYDDQYGGKPKKRHYRRKSKKSRKSKKNKKSRKV